MSAASDARNKKRGETYVPRPRRIPARAPYNGVPAWKVELAQWVLQNRTSNDLEDLADKVLQRALGVTDGEKR